jgi:isoquinoline 1-oxidoreductase subunit beta
MRRRTFLLLASASAGALGALVVGWSVLPPRQRLNGRHPLAIQNGEIALNGWIKLTPDGAAVVAMPRSEMGQGVLTGIAMIAAEELDLPLDRVSLVQAPPDKIFGNVKLLEDGLPFRDDDQGALARSARWIVAKGARELGLNITGASSTIKDLWLPVREAAAQARASLVKACAVMKGVAADTCTTADGFVVLASGARIAYGEIIRTAQSISPAARYSLKHVDKFKLLGTTARRVDARENTDGSAIFGIDVRLPGMRYAALVMAPSVGAKLESFNAPAGIAPIRIPAGYGQDEALAVVADGWWEASRMAKSVATTWDESAGATVDNASIAAAQRVALDTDVGRVYHEAGEVGQALKQAARRIDAEYTAPYLAHGTLEPMNCTAWVSDGKVRVWAPTQVPTFAVAVAAKVAGVGKDAVELTVTHLGGGFGRRLEVDFVAQTVAIAMKTEGRPVQMIWTREQDMTHDMYRPAATCHLSAGIDGDGRIIALETKLASDGIVVQWARRLCPALPDIVRDIVPDKTTVEGFFDTPYAVPHQRHAHVAVTSPVPVGNFRSVGHSLTSFFMESFIDELAAHLGKDPLVLRRELLVSKPRHLAVLNLAAEKAGYSGAKQRALKARRRALGLAIHESFSSIVAHVAEVSVHDDIGPRVHRVVSAVDVGLAVNPDLVAQQIEGAVVMGLSAALHGRIDVERGRVRQEYFTDYRILSMVNAPVVETHIVRSQESPRGIGEAGMPAIAPALANALFALTGERLRSLPLTLA